MSPEKHHLDIPEAPQPSFDLSSASANELNKRYPQSERAAKQATSNPSPRTKDLQEGLYTEIATRNSIIEPRNIKAIDGPVTMKIEGGWKHANMPLSSLTREQVQEKQKEQGRSDASGNSQSKRVGETF